MDPIFTIYNNQNINRLTDPLTKNRIKMWEYTEMDYYTAITNEIIHCITWMDLEVLFTKYS